MFSLFLSFLQDVLNFYCFSHSTSAMSLHGKQIVYLMDKTKKITNIKPSASMRTTPSASGRLGRAIQHNVLLYTKHIAT